MLTIDQFHQPSPTETKEKDGERSRRTRFLQGGRGTEIRHQYKTAENRKPGQLVFYGIANSGSTNEQTFLTSSSTGHDDDNSGRFGR